MCRGGQSVQIADGSGAPWPAHRFPHLLVAGPHRRPRRREPGVRHHGSQILVPPPVLYSQIRPPTEYPDGSTTFTPSTATPCPHTSEIAPVSRPLEDCQGCTRACWGNLGLAESSAGVQICIAISVSAAAGPRRAAAVRRAGSAQRGCTGRTVHRAEWQALAECVARGGEHVPDTPKSKRALRFSSLADPMPRSLPACQPCHSPG